MVGTLPSEKAKAGFFERKMYFEPEYFRKRVPRAVPPPSMHYWRVRAVFELFGNTIDPETKRPLFNAAAWKKANNVLPEIVAHHIAATAAADTIACCTADATPAADTDTGTVANRRRAASAMSSASCHAADDTHFLSAANR